MMQMMAPVVAKEEGIQATDYRDVLKALKTQQLGKDDVVPWYHEIIGKIEDTIRREHIITLPQRKMQMRLASEAETAPAGTAHGSAAVHRQSRRTRHLRADHGQSQRRQDRFV